MGFQNRDSFKSKTAVHLNLSLTFKHWTEFRSTPTNTHKHFCHNRFMTQGIQLSESSSVAHFLILFQSLALKFGCFCLPAAVANSLCFFPLNIKISDFISAVCMPCFIFSCVIFAFAFPGLFLCFFPLSVPVPWVSFSVHCSRLSAIFRIFFCPLFWCFAFVLINYLCFLSSGHLY